MSEYMARSTMPRVTYAKESVPPKNTRDLKRGDVVIVNDEYSRYKGELHIVLKDMPNDGRKNVIGHIPEDENMLLDYINHGNPSASCASIRKEVKLWQLLSIGKSKT